MQINATIKVINPAEEGTSKTTGNSWRRQDIVIGWNDPPALAYSNSICGNDQASVAYSTVYPLSMFLRVLVAQILVLMAL